MTISRYSTPAQILGFFGWLLLVAIIAGIGAVASLDAATFYAQLTLPSWAPPASVFGPVWTILYMSMAIAMWLVWRERNASYSRVAVALFLAQLGANALWSWLFFAWHQGALAFVDILVLLVLIIATLRVFWRVRRLAGLLLIPYLLWVGFATALTWTVWRGNLNVL